MQLVEQHRIDRHDPRWMAIDGAAFASKNLYNTALYLTRQVYINEQRVIGYAQLDKLMQSTSEYRALPAKVAYVRSKGLSRYRDVPCCAFIN